MSINIAQQTMMFLYALLLGGIIGAVYDVFRVTRVAFRLSWVLVLLEDALFFLISSIMLWRFFLEQSDGEFRVFALIGVLLGWLIYFLTIGNLIMRLSTFIIGVITRIIMGILAPLSKMCRAIKKYFNAAQKHMKLVKNPLNSRLYLLYNKGKQIRKNRQKNSEG